MLLHFCICRVTVKRSTQEQLDRYRKSPTVRQKLVRYWDGPIEDLRWAVERYHLPPASTFHISRCLSSSTSYSPRTYHCLIFRQFHVIIWHWHAWIKRRKWDSLAIYVCSVNCLIFSDKSHTLPWETGNKFESDSGSESGPKCIKPSNIGRAAIANEFRAEVCCYFICFLFACFLICLFCFYFEMRNILGGCSISPSVVFLVHKPSTLRWCRIIMVE